MKVQKKHIEKKDAFVTASVGLLFLSLLCLTIFLGYKWFTAPDVVTESSEESEDSQIKPSPTLSPWEVYRNEEFLFEIQIPRYLLKEYMKNKNEYVYILYFGENQYTRAKGVAVAITDRGFEEEVTFVTDAYAKDEEAKLVEEKKVQIGMENGTRFRYEPKDASKDLEEKDVVVVHKGDYTYTISSSPEQMDYILKTFKFL